MKQVKNILKFAFLCAFSVFVSGVMMAQKQRPASNRGGGGASRPSVSRPSTKNKPSTNNVNRPSVNRPSTNNVSKPPSINRPSTNNVNRPTTSNVNNKPNIGGNKNNNNNGDRFNNNSSNNNRFNNNNSNNNRPNGNNGRNNNVNINVNNNRNVFVNNSHNTRVRRSPYYRPYSRPPYRYGGYRYRCYHPYFYHPYRPFYWGPRWHPWGFFVATLATTAIIISIADNDTPIDGDAEYFVMSDAGDPAKMQHSLTGPYDAVSEEGSEYYFQDYYYDEGVFYMKVDDGYMVVAAPLGATIKTLPTGYETLTLDDGKTKNYYFGGTFYEKSDKGYTVVAPTAGTVVKNLPEGGEEVEMGDVKYVKVGDTYYQPIQQDGKDVYEIADVEEDK